MTKTPVTAPTGEVYFRYELPTERGAKMLLLTVGGICVTGDWYGELGQYFMAWSPMLKRDKEAERRLLQQHQQENP